MSTDRPAADASKRPETVAKVVTPPARPAPRTSTANVKTKG